MLILEIMFNALPLYAIFGNNFFFNFKGCIATYNQSIIGRKNVFYSYFNFDISARYSSICFVTAAYAKASNY